MRLSSLLILLVGLLSPSGPAAAGDHWAIFVGIDQYHQEQIAELRGAESDARSLADVLAGTLDIPKDQMFVFLGTSTRPEEVPSTGNIVKCLRYIATKATPEDTLVFFFAGHGMQLGENSFLMTYYTEPGALEYTGFAVSDLASLLRGIQAEHKLVLLDTCRDAPLRGRGANANPLREGLTRGITVESRTPRSKREVTAFLFSSSPGQRAYEVPGKGRGFFSYYLEEGLRGAAVDTTGAVTISSLVQFLSSRIPDEVRRRIGPEHIQEPYAILQGKDPGAWTLFRGVSTKDHKVQGLAIQEDAKNQVTVVLVRTEPKCGLPLKVTDPTGKETVIDEPYKNYDAIPGTWHVTALYEGFEPVDETFEVPAGDMTVFRVPLLPTGLEGGDGVDGGGEASVRSVPGKAGVEWVYSRPAKIWFARTPSTGRQFAECVSADVCTREHYEEPGIEDSGLLKARCSGTGRARWDHPINCVNWYGAKQFCEWVGGRLPSEQEWYAEASNNGTWRYPWGDQDPAPDQAVMHDDSLVQSTTEPVCTHPKGNSVSGLCDMAGNVYEWTSSYSDPDRSSVVTKGGSYLTEEPWYFQAIHRQPIKPDETSKVTGFRCVTAAVKPTEESVEEP